MLRALIYLLPLALAVYSFIDCLNTPENEVRHLPKVAWVFIILLFWVAGPLVWFLKGKKRTAPGGGWVAPDDNPEFLKSLGNGAEKDGPEVDEPGSDEHSGDESGKDKRPE
ncbi:MAG TPA: PLD nuclease N-terminal domain-containing protein [Streptomyces sp.]|jgi:hypothetical protein